MLNSIKVLSRGRILIGSTLATATFAVLAVFFSGWVQALSIALALVGAALVVFGIIAFLKLEAGLARQERRNLAKLLTDDEATLNAAVRKIGDKQARPQLSAALLTQNQNQDDNQNQNHSQNQDVAMRSEPQSIFAPNVITASRILAKPSAHVAGRNAALQSMSDDSYPKLERVLSAGDEERVRRVIWIGPHRSGIRERKGWASAFPYPGALVGSPDPEATYLVFNLRTTKFTPWEYVTSSQSYTQFEQIRNYINAAKANGTIVVVVEADVPSHFTASYEALGDIVWRPDSQLDSTSDFHSMPVFDYITNII